MKHQIELLQEACYIIACECEVTETKKNAINANSELLRLSRSIKEGSISNEDAKIVFDLIRDKINKIISQCEYDRQ